MNSVRLPGILAAIILAWLPPSLRALEAVPGVRMYVLDCGTMSIKDMALFSDTGKYDGQSGSLVDSCFLIRHPKGNLLWDTGLSDTLVGHDVPANADGVAIHVGQGLLDQLRQIDIAPPDITYVAFSHFHLDHTCNANAFGSATWILNRAGSGAQVMRVNTSRAETLASMDRVEEIIRNQHARLIVQHDPADYRRWPRSPAYID